MSSYSIVEYLGGSNDGKCGYCKQTGNYNSHGFWAHTMNVDDYQGLINRNWRRSGQYCYLPQNNNTCCPMYTIKCDALNFKLTRSHKKILKKVNKFLHDGVKAKEKDRCGTVPMTGCEQPTPSKEHSKFNVANMSVNKIKEMSSTSGVVSTSSTAKVSSDDYGEISQNNLNKKALNPKKKKFLRVEKKMAKLAAKKLTLNDVVKKKRKNVEKTLEDYLSEEPKNGKHKLEVKLVQSTEGSTDKILELYRSYQLKIHDDPPEKNTKRGYERFLVNSPLQTKLINATTQGSNINVSFNLFCKYETTIHESNDNKFDDFNQFLVTSPLKYRKNDESPPEGFGSFHYQYYLDDELIAVGVLDILPQCVSSVYFFYNPEFNFLSLGTYASLREIALVRQLSKSCALLSSYYLGFYIPTCPKMRYKSNVQPSYLLCPEVFTFHLLDAQLSKDIDAVKYLRINKNETDKDAVTVDDLSRVLVLFNRSAMKYGDFQRANKSKKSNDTVEVLEYASKVGKKLSQSMLLYRS